LSQTLTAQNYKSKLLERLTLETVQSRLSVKDSMEYVIKYFHRTGTTDFTLSQSYYEKLRKSVRQKLENKELKLIQKPIELSSDNEKINDMIDIYYLKIQNEALKPEGKPSALGSSTKDEYRDWSTINETTATIIKLIQLKNKMS